MQIGESVIIVDAGSQVALPVARMVRAHRVFCEVVRPEQTEFYQDVAGCIIWCGTGPVKALEKDLNIPVWQVETVPSSEQVRSFLFEKCTLTSSWTPENFIRSALENIKQEVGEGRVLCALSGGVDSAVVSLLLHRAIGKQLICIFVDHGFLREGEPEQVRRMFGENFGISLIFVDARERFLQKICGIIDPEEKRRIIGEEFIRVFEEKATELAPLEFLGQGTIYPDIIESGTGSGELVKTHHNVGGLPENLNFKLIEPLKRLFKNEVREVGESLGLPKEIVWRQPFPGPGLAVRVLGEVTGEKLSILRRADTIVREEIARAGLAREVWQYFAVLPSIQSTGIEKGRRMYNQVIVVRAVNTVDAMTADWVRLPYELLSHISDRITGSIPEVNRVVYDITAKPPGTIEWE